jgi:hypothetical protein
MAMINLGQNRIVDTEQMDLEEITSLIEELNLDVVDIEGKLANHKDAKALTGIGSSAIWVNKTQHALKAKRKALHGLYAEQKQRKREINKAMQDEWRTNAYWQFVQVARRTLSNEMFDAILNEAKVLADSYKENTDGRS